jgi:hypothetical protein
MTDEGALLFARYAYPPNSLGYCGPDDPDALLDQVAARVVDGALSEAARGFEGAWPYLELIAHCNAGADPLAHAVVEAYWVGNRLLEQVTLGALGDSFEERFRRRVGRAWDDLLAGVLAGARPHHNFHVFGVYPWLGLIRAGVVDQPLTVLDGCRIRWGRLLSVEGDEAVVMSRPLEWDDAALQLGRPRAEVVTIAAAGRHLAADPVVGDWVSLHWDWVCDRLTEQQVRRLRRETYAALGTVNRTGRPAPAAVLA